MSILDLESRRSLLKVLLRASGIGATAVLTAGCVGARAAQPPRGAAPRLGVALPTDARVLSVRHSSFGAVGDGIADDSAAFDAWFATLVDAEYAVGYVPPGHYRVPNLSPVVTKRPLTIFGAGRDNTIIDGEGSRTLESPFISNGILVGGPICVSGITFRRWENVFVFVDGSADWYARNGSEDFSGSGVNGPIDGVIIRDCGFDRCRRALVGFLAGKYRLSRVEICNNWVSDVWAGFYLHTSNLTNLRVTENTILDVDGTASGTTAARGGAGNPIRTGSSCAASSRSRPRHRPR